MRRKKRNRLVLLLVVLLTSVSLGYAFLTQELTINGTGKVTSSSWNIYFDNLVLNQDNVALSTGDVAATIDSTTLTDVTYTITLQKPGDFYEFTVDVVNDGTLDAMVGTVSNKLNNVEIDATHPLPNYLNYSVTYSDGGPIRVNQLLEKNSSETYKVRLEYRTDITANDLPSTAQTLTLNFSAEYVQADSNAVVVTHPVSFSTDSWETVVSAVKAGNTDAYHVGDTKSITLNSLGTFSVRIANITTPSQCYNDNFSQTACGFVLEFVNTIVSRNYGGTNSTNEGGWPSSSLRSYIKSTVYNDFPEVLKNSIIDTRVISGHGSTAGETNFTSIDKLYLLALVEVYGVVESDYDTLTTSQTRQLDYYENNGVTLSNPSGSAKYTKNGSNFISWWLRSPKFNRWYWYIGPNGYPTTESLSNSYPVVPAFRLAGPEP